MPAGSVCGRSARPTETGGWVVKPLTGRRCLVLDDEFLIALDIQQALEQAGAAEVVCCGNAAEALAAAGTPFVFLTGLRGDSAEARVFRDAPVVEKPYDARALLAAIGQATGGTTA